MFEQHPSQPSRTQGQYRTAGFAEHMSIWRERTLDELEIVEAVTRAIEKQVDAGTVTVDAYYDAMQDRLEDLRQQLAGIDDETNRW